MHKSKKRFVVIAAVFALFIAVLYLSLYITGKLPWQNSFHSDSPYYIIENQNTLFYQNFKDGGKLYRMDLNGSHNKKLCNDYVMNLVTDGEYIYYSNLRDGKTYRIKPDGTNRQVLDKINGDSLEFLNDWIYFSSQQGVFKVQKDGSQLIKLSDIPSSDVTIYNGTIYFKTYYGNMLFSMKPDGSNLNKVINEPIHPYKIVDNQIYFESASDFKIYKIKTDGTGLQKVIDYPLSTNAFDVKDHNIYFTSDGENQGTALYKVQDDGTNLKKLVDLEATTLKAIGNSIYCFHPASGGRLYKVSLDGKTVEEIKPGRGLFSFL